MKPIIVMAPLGDNPPKAELYYGQNVLDTLKVLPDQSVQMCATSPPYWGLRDYGGEAPTWDDGWTGHLGHEPTPQLFVNHLVIIFREVRRVLRDDGVLWLNLGDSYATQSPVRIRGLIGAPSRKGLDIQSSPKPSQIGLKHKDLVGIPWMAAFALRADGWYLRSDIIWSKPSCMPEAVKDRPTKSHEYIFLLTKNARYFYDQEAIREPSSDVNQTGRNHRTVWNINPKGYPGAHFATWPPALVDLMVKAGSSEHGCCSACGAPWRRKIERETRKGTGVYDEVSTPSVVGSKIEGSAMRGNAGKNFPPLKRTMKGWEPTCDCDASVSPCTVLDPFSGSATTGMVALQLGRNYIGCDLQPDYLDLAIARLESREAPSGHDDESDLLWDLFPEPTP